METQNQPSYEADSSPAYTGVLLSPEARILDAEPKTGRRTRVQSAFGHSFHIFFGNGVQVLRINNSEITVNSDVTASIGEMTQGDVPHMGDANMAVMNIAPFNGGALVRVNVDWRGPLRFQVMLNYSL